jgi:glycine/D-amino acid oxidase-like deaminating enzyme
MERAEIAIVGAGISGLSIAWHLLERGSMRVALYEKAGVASVLSLDLGAGQGSTGAWDRLEPRARCQR